MCIVPELLRFLLMALLCRDSRALDTSDLLHVDRVNSCDERLVTINVLPDDVLLHVFHFYRLPVAHLDEPTDLKGVDLGARLSWRWDRLVHVCRRWRSVVFASPNFLNLKLVCRPWSPVELTAIWPPLPIIVRDGEYRSMPGDYDIDAIIMHRNRVCEIEVLHSKESQCQRLASAMQMRFPELIRFCLAGSYTHPALTLPDGFLSESTSRLQSLSLVQVIFPALPKLLLSATHLVSLTLWGISGYISPEEIVTGLSGSLNLKNISIKTESSLSRPNWGSRRPPPPVRIVLPALTRFMFDGVSKCLDDLVARIDAPLLDTVRINFIEELMFDLAQLAQFMKRATRFQALNEAHVVLWSSSIEVLSHPPKMFRTLDGISGFKISCEEVDWGFSTLEQLFTSLSPPIHTVEHLYIHGFRYFLSNWQEYMESNQWLEIFHPFTAVKNLYVINEFAQCIAPALQNLAGGSVTEVLPALENLFLEELQPLGLIPEGIGKFVAARQLSSHSITISLWETDYYTVNIPPF